MHWIIILIYGFALLFIFFYSLVQLYLSLKYRTYKRRSVLEQEPKEPIEFPSISVQLPIFNEKYVVERLLDSILLLDYPRDLLEVQVLDDSTDDSSELVRKKVQELKAEGLDIHYLHREDREGFKAGALAAALPKAKGELIAIFDADFLPKSDFLKQMVPPFQDPKVGMVQSRWVHLNKDYSVLTSLQAFGLDAHFSVEQGGRNAGDHFINFNGTAGIWRKEAIVDAGGWQSDTLTEDLDLSYRAQLQGWKFVYKEEVESPAELPAEINALKTQQYRWNKGAAECVRKNLMKVIRAKHLSLTTKVNAIFHLMNSAVFICIILLAILSMPMMLIKEKYVELNELFWLASLFLISLPILSYFYWSSEQRNSSFPHFLLRFPAFLSVSMGLSLHNAIAVAEGYLGRKSPFIRTPKFNIQNKEAKGLNDNVYMKRRLSPLVYLEILLAIYFLFGIGLAFVLSDFGLLPFHLMLFLGFAFIASTSIYHAAKYY